MYNLIKYKGKSLHGTHKYMYDFFSAVVAKNRTTSLSIPHAPSAHHHIASPPITSDSQISSYNRKTSQTVCCYSNSNIASNNHNNIGNLIYQNRNQSQVNVNNINNSEKSNCIGNKYSKNNKKICGNIRKSYKTRVKSDPTLGGLNVNLVNYVGVQTRANDECSLVKQQKVSPIQQVDVKSQKYDGKNYYNQKLLAKNNNTTYTSGAANINRTANVLCTSPSVSSTSDSIKTPIEIYENSNICFKNNSQLRVNHPNNKNNVTLKAGLTTSQSNSSKNNRNDRHENINLLNCFTSKIGHHDSRSSLSSQSVASETISSESQTDESHTAIADTTRQSSLTITSNDDTQNNSAREQNNLTNKSVSNKSGVIIRKLYSPTKKSLNFAEIENKLNSLDRKNKQIPLQSTDAKSIIRNGNLFDQVNDFSFIDSSGNISSSVSDDKNSVSSSISEPSVLNTSSTSAKRAFLHTIPTVNSPLLDLSTEISNEKLNRQLNKTSNINQPQIKIKEFYEQKSNLQNFKSMQDDPCMTWTSYPFESVLSESNHKVKNSKNKKINLQYNKNATITDNNNDKNAKVNKNENKPYLINYQVPATVPRLDSSLRLNRKNSSNSNNNGDDESPETSTNSLNCFGDNKTYSNQAYTRYKPENTGSELVSFISFLF